MGPIGKGNRTVRPIPVNGQKGVVKAAVIGIVKNHHPRPKKTFTFINNRDFAH